MGWIENNVNQIDILLKSGQSQFQPDLNPIEPIDYNTKFMVKN